MVQCSAMFEELKQHILIQFKEVFSISDFCLYTGFSKPYAYRIVKKKVLPFYKPLGKEIFFRKEDVISFLTSNKVESKKATEQQVSKFIINSKIN